MLTSHRHGLPSHHLRLRSDLLDLHNECEQTGETDTIDAVESLSHHGFNRCHPEPEHWVLCRGSQRVHLYSMDELTRFARRYSAPDPVKSGTSVPVKSRTSSKETSS